MLEEGRGICGTRLLMASNGDARNVLTAYRSNPHYCKGAANQKILFVVMIVNDIYCKQTNNSQLTYEKYYNF